jgi:hypothetical protein
MIQTMRMTVPLMVDNIKKLSVNVLFWLCTPSPPLFSRSLGVQAKQVTMYKYGKFSKFNNKDKKSDFVRPILVEHVYPSADNFICFIPHLIQQI